MARKIKIELTEKQREWLEDAVDRIWDEGLLSEARWRKLVGLLHPEWERTEIDHFACLVENIYTESPLRTVRD